MNEYGLKSCDCGKHPDVQVIESFAPPGHMVVECRQCRKRISGPDDWVKATWNQERLIVAGTINIAGDFKM